MTTDELDSLVSKFVIEEIALGQEDISAAVKSKEWLLNRIISKIAEYSNGPQLYASETTVGYGSYFARLKVANVDEMDFLIVIDSNSGVFRNADGSTKGTGLGSESPNHKYDTKFLKPDLSGVSPKKLQEWLRDICWEVLQPLSGQMPEIDGPAVKVVLKSSGIQFDLVPAGIFEINASSSIFYNIPKGNIGDEWTLTNPKKDLERVNGLADQRNDFRNVIRLVKFSRDGYSLTLSSYAIQCAGCEYAEKYQWQNSLFTDFRNALWVLADKIKKGVIEDGYDTSINLLGGTSDLNALSEKVTDLYKKLDRLYDESDADTAYEKLCDILKNSLEEKNMSALWSLQRPSL